MTKIYHDVDEWLDEVLAEDVHVTRRMGLPGRGEYYVKEAWRQATLSTRAQARVQQEILQGEISGCKEKLDIANDQIRYLQEVVKKEIR